MVMFFCDGGEYKYVRELRILGVGVQNVREPLFLHMRLHLIVFCWCSEATSFYVGALRNCAVQ